MPRNADTATRAASKSPCKRQFFAATVWKCGARLVFWRSTDGAMPGIAALVRAWHPMGLLQWPAPNRGARMRHLAASLALLVPLACAAAGQDADPPTPATANVNAAEQARKLFERDWQWQLRRAP